MAVREDKQGIIIAELDKHMLNIMDCSDKVKSIFNKIDDQMAILMTHYSCSAANTLFRQYEEFNENFAIIVENLLSYKSDLLALKKSYALVSSEITDQLKSKAAMLTAGLDKYKEKR